MNKAQLLVTAAGPDRIGFVQELTAVLVRHDANIEESRMARLAGDFAALVLVTVPEDKLEMLLRNIRELCSRNIDVWTRVVPSGQGEPLETYRLYSLTVTGADHEGIIQTIAHALTEMGINIAELESDVVHAPTTGSPLFNMRADLQIPTGLPLEEVKEKLRRAANEMAVLVQIEES